MWTFATCVADPSKFEYHSQEGKEKKSGLLGGQSARAVANQQIATLDNAPLSAKSRSSVLHVWRDHVGRLLVKGFLADRQMVSVSKT